MGWRESLRFTMKIVRFVHKMYVRSKGLEFSCFAGDFRMIFKGFRDFGLP